MTGFLAQYGAPSEPPDVWSWSFAGQILPDLLRGLAVVVRVTVIAITLALILGLMLALLRRSRFYAVRLATKAIIEFVRSTPLLAQLFFVYFGLPSVGLRTSPVTAGIATLAVHYACYTSETYRAGIESVPRGQWAAAVSLSMGGVTTWRHVVLPQAIPTVMPALGNYVIAMMKEVPLLASITVFELLSTAQRIQGFTFRGLEPFTIAGVLFLAVSLPASLIVRSLERHYAFQRT